MKIRALLLGSTILVALPLGCSEPTTQPQVPPPARAAGAPEAKTTEKGVQVSKGHTLPLGADPNAVSSGP